MSKTIAKNSKFAKSLVAVDIKLFTLNNQFRGETVDLSRLSDILSRWRCDRNATMYHHTKNSVRVAYNSNRWIDIRYSL